MIGNSNVKPNIRKPFRSIFRSFCFLPNTYLVRIRSHMSDGYNVLYLWEEGDTKWPRWQNGQVLHTNVPFSRPCLQPNYCKSVWRNKLIDLTRTESDTRKGVVNNRYIFCPSPTAHLHTPSTITIPHFPALFSPNPRTFPRKKHLPPLAPNLHNNSKQISLILTSSPWALTLALAGMTLTSCIHIVSGLIMSTTGLLEDWVIQYTRPGWPTTSDHCTKGWVLVLPELLPLFPPLELKVTMIYLFSWQVFSYEIDQAINKVTPTKTGFLLIYSEKSKTLVKSLKCHFLKPLSCCHL